MKRPVAIVGTGCSNAGARYDCSQEDLIVEAGLAALDAAGLTADDVQASWFACNTVSANHALLNFSLKLGYKPMTKCSNAGASGADVIRNACLAVASGAYDIVLGAGVEKPCDSGIADLTEGDVLSGGSQVGADSVLGDLRPPVHAALYLVRYASAYGVPLERICEALGRIVIKNRRHGAQNDKAALREPVHESDVRASPLSAWPLTMLDCCASFDGAAAAIVCSLDVAQRLGRPHILLQGLGSASGGGQGRLLPSYEFTSVIETRIAAERAYAMAGITDPLHEIDHAQLFDSTSGWELLAYEDLGFVPVSTAVDRALDGAFDLEGVLPTNTDGGLLSNGFQSGASGLRQVHESFLQLTGQAGVRQLPNVRRSLVHTQGGHAGSFTSCVQIFGR